MAIETFEEALAWVYETRNTCLALGNVSESLDRKIVQQCRENGVFESIPLIALEHRRLNAVYKTGRIRKELHQELDLIRRMDDLGRKLLAAGWIPIQLTANALNKTVERAKEYVAAGFVSAQYGLPVSKD